MGDSEIISSAACSLVGGLPALSSDHRGFSVLDSAFQDPSTSDQFTRMVDMRPILSTTAGYTPQALHLTFASEHQPMSLQMDRPQAISSQHRDWLQPGFNKRKHSVPFSAGGHPVMKRSRTGFLSEGTANDPICVDDSSSSSDGLSPMDEGYDHGMKDGCIKEEVVVFQEVEQSDDEGLTLQSLTGECSITVPDTTSDPQAVVVLRDCERFDYLPSGLPMSLSSLHSTGDSRSQRHESGEEDLDLFRKGSNSCVKYGYDHLVMRSLRQAEGVGLMSSRQHDMKEGGMVLETGRLSIPELSGVISEADSGIVKGIDDGSICGLTDDSLSPFLTSWHRRASDSESLASTSDVNGSFSSGCGGSTTSSGVWASSGNVGPGEARQLAARISLGGSLDTATRQLMEAREAVKKLEGDRTMSKLRITARSLYQVAFHGNLEKVVLLLSKGSDPNSRNSKANGQTPMHAAAEKGCVATLMALREAGGEVNTRDSNMKTPIFKSIERGHLLAVEFLIHAGAEIDLKESSGMTPLHMSVKKGYADIAGRLLQTGRVDLDQKDDGGWTAVVWAADLKHLRTFRCLLEHGADLHAKDEEGNICLHWAAYSGSTEVVELILHKSSFVNAVNVHGDTPLHISVRRGHLECARNLLVKGADLSLPNNDEVSPMQLADYGSALFKLLKTFEDLRRLKSYRKTPGPRLLSSDMSLGRESVYIPCCNEVDDEPPPQFVYVTEPYEGPLVRVERRLNTLQGCSCEGSCSSNRLCACARLNTRKRLWYDEDGRMSSDIEKLFKPLVFECNVNCKCKAECRNRVVQDRMKYPLEVFRTKSKGWGVRSLSHIPKGSFVCEYTGLLLTDGEADKIEDDTYLFDLDVEEEVVGCMCIDARGHGNVSRFINHSCEPNVFPVRVYTTHQDRRFPRMAFFNRCDIQPGEEICFDYGPRFWKIKNKQFPCLCETSSCQFNKKGSGRV